MADVILRLSADKKNGISSLAVAFAAKGYVVLLAQPELLKPIEIARAMRGSMVVSHLHVSVDFDHEVNSSPNIAIWKTDADGFPRMIPSYSLRICLDIGSSSELPQIIVDPGIGKPHFLIAIVKQVVKETIGLIIK